MSSNPSDLEQFHQFVTEQLASGAEHLTPEDCLEVWRAAHPSPEEYADTLEAIEEGLSQARRGEGLPAEEFMRRFELEKGLSDKDA